ncbi:DEAD/DEAH box helicase family protein [Streptomyces anthocyanicus]
MNLVDVPRPGRPVRPDLFPDQVEAVERLVRHLRRPGSRGLFVSATGTGKTLVSIRVADGLGARLVLFVVPTLDLAAQTALAWRREHHLEHMVIVSSMDTSGRDDLVAARVMSTANPHALGGLMSVVGEGQDQIPALTVICTYDSLDKIEATQRTGFEVPAFDLAVMDFTNRRRGVWDVRVEWSVGVGEGCGLGAGVPPTGRPWVRRGRRAGGWPVGGGRVTGAGDRPRGRAGVLHDRGHGLHACGGGGRVPAFLPGGYGPYVRVCAGGSSAVAAVRGPGHRRGVA